MTECSHFLSIILPYVYELSSVLTRTISSRFKLKALRSTYKLFMQEESIDKVQYVRFEDLTQPAAQSISQGSISLGFQSKQWFIQFQTITALRQANKHYSTLFLKELLPLNAKQIVAQVDNLRSNNSKEALTLLTEVIEMQDLVDVSHDVIRPIVAALMAKSVSEKGFLKAQALKGANALPRRWNEGALDELCLHTSAANGVVSELAIRLVGEMLQNNKEWRVDGKFLKSLSGNLNGKRAVVQKKARQILRCIKEREGEGPLEQKISSSTQLLEEESNTLRRELKEKEEKAKGPSLKDFLKAKKQQES